MDLMPFFSRVGGSYGLWSPGQAHNSGSKERLP